MKKTIKVIFDFIVIMGSIAAGFCWIVFGTYMLPIIEKELTGNFTRPTMLFLSLGVAFGAIMFASFPLNYLFKEETKMKGGLTNDIRRKN